MKEKQVAFAAQLLLAATVGGFTAWGIFDHPKPTPEPFYQMGSFHNVDNCYYTEKSGLAIEADRVWYRGARITKTWKEEVLLEHFCEGVVLNKDKVWHIMLDHQWYLCKSTESCVPIRKETP